MLEALVVVLGVLVLLLAGSIVASVVASDKRVGEVLREASVRHAASRTVTTDPSERRRRDTELYVQLLKTGREAEADEWLKITKKNEKEERTI